MVTSWLLPWGISGSVYSMMTSKQENPVICSSVCQTKWGWHIKSSTELIHTTWWVWKLSTCEAFTIIKAHKLNHFPNVSFLLLSIQKLIGFLCREHLTYDENKSITSLPWEDKRKPSVFREDFIIAWTWRHWAQCERKALGAKGTACAHKGCSNEVCVYGKMERKVREGSLGPWYLRGKKRFKSYGVELRLTSKPQRKPRDDSVWVMALYGCS